MEYYPLESIGSLRPDLKEMVLGELVCQSGYMSDDELLDAIESSRRRSCSLGRVLVELGILTPERLFSLRRLSLIYLGDPEDADRLVEQTRALLAGSDGRRAGTPHLSLVSAAS